MAEPEIVKGFLAEAYVININREPMPAVARSYRSPYRIPSPTGDHEYTSTKIEWVNEKYDVGDYNPLRGRDNRGERIISALAIAEDICQEINSRIPGVTDSFWGVFASESPKPRQWELEEARKRLDNVFTQLVAAADQDWERYHRHDFIADTARVAAKNLGIEDRGWLVIARRKEKCPACGLELAAPDVAIHPACGAILNDEKARKFRLGPYAGRPEVPTPKVLESLGSDRIALSE